MSQVEQTGQEEQVLSANATYTPEYIFADYHHNTTTVTRSSPTSLPVASMTTTSLQFRTQRKVKKLGVMLVGWGGNNGTTLTAAVLANRHQLHWRTRSGVQQSNWFGSVTQTSTVRLGTDASTASDVWVPMKTLLPLVPAESLELDGWDISALDLSSAMERAQVLDIQLQEQLKPLMSQLKPRPSVFCPDFVAANQHERADNILLGTRAQQLQQLRDDIRHFKRTKQVEEVIVLWTANTERFSSVVPGHNDTSASLLQSIESGAGEVSPSTLFAVASILENCSYINGSPQNTFLPSVLQLAEERGVVVAGDDFKSGQTKLKSVLVDFLVSSGIAPRAIVSYNHLGNNDGKNLMGEGQFKSKEISKASVIEDVVHSNEIMFPKGTKGPDHVVVIKYVPTVGDSKRAMDEYTSEIMMGGKNTLVIHNTCEDSLLAAPLMLDLILLAELCGRISFRRKGEEEWQSFETALVVLSLFLKAPLPKMKTGQVVNSFFSQRSTLIQLMRACLGLPPEDYLGMALPSF